MFCWNFLLLTKFEDILVHRKSTYWYQIRSSHKRYFIEKDVLKNIAKLIGRRLCKSLLFNKVAGLRHATLLNKRLWHKCFPVNLAKFLKTIFLQNTTSGGCFCQILVVYHCNDTNSKTSNFDSKPSVVSFQRVL